MTLISGSPLTNCSFSGPRCCGSQSRSSAWCAITTSVESELHGPFVSTFVTYGGCGTYTTATHWEGGGRRSLTHAVGNTWSGQSLPRSGRPCEHGHASGCGRELDRCRPTRRIA